MCKGSISILTFLYFCGNILTLIMKRPESLTAPQRKEAFLETLANVQEELDGKGIDYRVIGSLASHAYLDSPSTEITPLNYDRPGAACPDQKVPDIDLIVPRADLVEARKIRTKALTGIQPVKVGVAIPTTDIDFRPGESESFLTHKDITLPVDSDLFRVQEDVSLEGVPIKTMPIDTLAHTYGTFVGRVRQKDMPIIKELIRKSDGPPDPRTRVFHEFQRQRRKRSPGEHRFNLAFQAFEDNTPRRMRNEMYRAALVAADLLGKR